MQYEWLQDPWLLNSGCADNPQPPQCMVSKALLASTRASDTVVPAQAAAVGGGHGRGLRGVRLQPAGQDVPAEDGVGVARRDVRGQ